MNVETFSEDFNEVMANKPPSPTADRTVEVSAVGKRCVYLNNYRIAGSKPYVSENLPWHDHNTTLGEVLDAFSEEDIRKALDEKAEQRAYIQRYHAWKNVS
jgi:hypothetical protein